MYHLKMSNPLKFSFLFVARLWRKLNSFPLFWRQTQLVVCQQGQFGGMVSFLDATYGLKLLIIYCDWRSSCIPVLFVVEKNKQTKNQLRLFVIEVVLQSR